MPSGTGWAELIPPQVLSLWANEATRPGLVFLALAGLVFLIPTRPRRDRQVSQRREVEQDVHRPTNTPWPRRLWWTIRRPHDLMRVDGLVLERTGKRSHSLWLGPTGYGKSTAVATVRVDGARPTLILTPDLSDPMIEAVQRLGGFHWTACSRGIPVDFLIGESQDVAERLTEVFRSGGTGAWKMTARRATTDVIREIDHQRIPRSLLVIGEYLQAATKDDRELKIVCAGWVERFLSTAQQFGDSIRAGGEDIAELLQDGQTVLLDNDAFDHPGIKTDVVAFGLAEAKRIARLVPGGYRLIFEEAQQLGERIDLADPFFLAGRRRKIAVDALAQSEDALDDAITQNSATRVYFAQRRKSLQKDADDVLGIGYRELDPARMADYTAWVASEKVRRLARFPRPPKPVPATDIVEDEITDTDHGYVEHVPVPIARERAKLPMLPPPSPTMQKLLTSLEYRGGCLRWKGAHDKKGYGRIWIDKTADRDGYNDYVHLVAYEQAYGPIPRDPETGERIGQVDHTCRVNDCAQVAHLEYVSAGENSRRMHRVRGHKTRANAAD